MVVGLGVGQVSGFQSTGVHRPQGARGSGTEQFGGHHRSSQVRIKVKIRVLMVGMDFMLLGRFPKSIFIINGEFQLFPIFINLLACVIFWACHFRQL